MINGIITYKILRVDAMGVSTKFEEKAGQIEVLFS